MRITTGDDMPTSDRTNRQGAGPVDRSAAWERASAVVLRAGLRSPVLALPLVLAVAFVAAAGDRARRAGHDRGASVMEWVLILAVTITIVTVVAAIVIGKLRTKATELDLTTPGG